MTRLVAAVFALVVLFGTPARAQDSGVERIRSFTFDATIEDDGDLVVRETIVYDFGSDERHGIFRDIPTRLTYDDRYDRVYRLHDVAVSSETAPDDVERASGPAGTTRLRIGDPDRTINGVHTYLVEYRLEGALNPFPEHVELYWNALGAEWQIPVDAVAASVTAPTAMERAACFSGFEGSQLPCDDTTVDGRTARFRDANLAPFEAMTFVAGLPRGSVSATGPILVERWSAARAFSVTPATSGAAGGLLAVVVAGVAWLVWRTGRDRRAVGGTVDIAFAEAGAVEERVPLLGRGETPVQVEPPEGLRPGLLGTLIDERANPLDVTATIVDLAVRGWLRIEEIEKEGWFGKPDWNLVKLKDDTSGLHPYEVLLFNGLFEGQADREVRVSELKDKFANRLEKVQHALYDDVVDRGWFRGRPDRTRTAWTAVAIAVMVVGGGLTALAAARTRLGIVPIPIVIGGLVLLALAGRMPHRTAKGTGVLVRTLGFKRFIDDSERDRARFAEQQHLFTEYLPYAVVFGATERWARAFAGIDGALPDQSSWYVGTRPFTVGYFGSSMDGFATTSAGTIASTPSGSGTSGFGGGGFSGGGGGGGGGGSW